jgi:nitroimidazol reductase NimA-like FMN-containing flavoprotein (pyridoxamine 5'-phosphate oxidase superfamily)
MTKNTESTKLKKKASSKPASLAKGSSKQPVATRPKIPASYGIAKTTKGMLDWSWARKRLTTSHNYVIVTVRPDGRPHAMGMHGLWIDDTFYFGTGKTTRKTKNLEQNRNCILINERLDELVIVEGTAEVIDAKQLPPGASAASKEKYGWPMGRTPGGVVFKVRPRVVFALPEMLFATAPTRWLFE